MHRIRHCCRFATRIHIHCRCAANVFVPCDCINRKYLVVIFHRQLITVHCTHTHKKNTPKTFCFVQPIHALFQFIQRWWRQKQQNWWGIAIISSPKSVVIYFRSFFELDSFIGHLFVTELWFWSSSCVLEKCFYLSTIPKIVIWSPIFFHVSNLLTNWIKHTQ